MANLPLVLSILLSFCVLCFTSNDPVFSKNSSAVVVLDYNNFKKKIDSGGSWFVYFYAPWCQHCKQISPILDEVASSLQDYPDLHIGKFDSTTENENKQLSLEYDVEAYPTLLYFKNGIYGKYQGGRSKDDIFQFMLKLNETSHEVVHKQSELDAILKIKKYAFVLSIPAFTTTSSSSLLSEEMASALTNEWITLFEQLSNHWHLKSHFILYFYNNKKTVKDKNKTNDHNHHIFLSRMELNKQPLHFIPPPSPLLSQSAETKSDSNSNSHKLAHLKPPTYELLESFVYTHNHPFLISVDNQNANFLGNLNKTLLLLVLDVKIETAATSTGDSNSNSGSVLLKSYEDACYSWYTQQQQQVNSDAATTTTAQTNTDNSNQQQQKYTYEDLLFGYMDGIKYKNYLTRYDIKPQSSLKSLSPFPALILLNMTHDLYYTLPLSSLLFKNDKEKDNKDVASSTAVNQLSSIVSQVLNQYLYIDFNNLDKEGNASASTDNKAIIDNNIIVKMKVSKKLTWFDKFKKKFSDNYPWSYIICSVPIVLLLISFLLPQPSDSKVKQH